MPAKNEAPTIEPLLDDIARDCAGLAPFEVVYVDDGSTDDTQGRLAAARAARPWLHVLRHAESCGKSAALRTGARAARAPLLVTLDGDGQNDPKFVPRLVSIAAKPTQASASSPASGCGRGDSGLQEARSPASPTACASALLKDGTRDTACGLKAIRRDVFLACRTSTPCIASSRPW